MITQGIIQHKKVAQGISKKTNKPYTRATYEINGGYFSTFDVVIIETFKEGENVTLDYDSDGKYYTIREMKYTDISNIPNTDLTGVQSPSLLQTPVKPFQQDKDKLIIRQSCLKAAIETLNETERTDTKVILDLAEQYEKWVWR